MPEVWRGAMALPERTIFAVLLDLAAARAARIVRGP
jgi:hypothetical protein